MRLPKLLAPLAFTLLTASAMAAEMPKLVLAIVVDQLRYDYLERFSGSFGEGGLRLLMEKGAFLTSANYDYMPTVTGPGHATLLSGCPPSVHGIISNDWTDRNGQSTNCVGDPNAKSVGGKKEKASASPRNFIGSTLADQMRLHFGSKVVGVSIKDRAAILPAGKKPSGAYWFDEASGNFITSTYYMPQLPDWVQQFNEKLRPRDFMGQTWDRLAPASAYAGADDAEGEDKLPGGTSVFPHQIPADGSFGAILPTPFGSQLLAEFAVAALDGEKLGLNGKPDLLTVSFSSIDICGHLFGPYSHEVQDLVLRLDQQLAALFAEIDKRIGMANVVVVLSADHGVAPTITYAKSQGFDAEKLDSIDLMGQLTSVLAQKFGPGKLIRFFKNDQIYFDQALLAERKLSPETIADAVREWALLSGHFQAVYSRAQLLNGTAPGRIGRLATNGYNAERSGDVLLVAKPFSYSWAKESGTTHGSPYSYDTHVPLLFFGAGFKSGRIADPVAVTDIAPTLCTLLHLEPPAGCIGAPIVKALQEH